VPGHEWNFLLLQSAVRGILRTPDFMESSSYLATLGKVIFGMKVTDRETATESPSSERREVFCQDTF